MWCSDSNSENIYGGTAKDDVISIECCNAQKQSGAKDCGVFALANAFHLANGDKVCRSNFDQRKMREHVVQCFTKGKFSAFPVVNLQFKELRLRRFSCNCIVYVKCQNVSTTTWSVASHVIPGFTTNVLELHASVKTLFVVHVHYPLGFAVLVIVDFLCYLLVYIIIFHCSYKI